MYGQRRGPPRVGHQPRHDALPEVWLQDSGAHPQLLPQIFPAQLQRLDSRLPHETEQIAQAGNTELLPFC